MFGFLIGFLKWLFGRRPKKKKHNLKKIDAKKRFDLLGRTGQGSMSKVWRARDKEIGRNVCLKVLDKKKTSDFEDRFNLMGLTKPAEGTICAALRHKNIVQTLDHGISLEGEQLLIMELIEGDGLNLLIETHSPRLKGKRVPYLIQVADGLEYIHNQRYLHRDICPRNIMVTRDDVIKLIDFGLTIPYTAEYCRPGNRTGTTNYLAPELIKRTQTDHRVDLFALGVTAYELFTGQLPWEKAQSMQTLLNHLNSPGRDPRTFVPDMDPALVRFLMKAVERNPADRFQNVAEFREALRALPKQDY